MPDQQAKLESNNTLHCSKNTFHYKGKNVSEIGVENMNRSLIFNSEPSFYLSHKIKRLSLWPSLIYKDHYHSHSHPQKHFNQP